MRQVDRSCAITRPSSAYLDGILGVAFPVLDHGFVRVMDYMGTDHEIEQAARLSYGSGTRKSSETQGLLNYLMSHHHMTPFEMNEIKLHIKMPIMVMRQWVRHRAASINEYSARYSILDREFYIPDISDLAHQSKDNKQGRDVALDASRAKAAQDALTEHSGMSYELYELLMNEDEFGLARELARMSLPVNFYTQIFWKTDLRNLFHFLGLRNDKHAQKEIRDYAEIIELITQDWVPMAHASYRVYRKNTITFNELELSILKDVITGKMTNITDRPEGLGFSKREWATFLDKLSRIPDTVA